MLQQILEPEQRIYMINLREQLYALSNNTLYQLDRNYYIIKQHSVNFPYYLGYKHPKNPNKFLSDKPQHYIVHKIYGKYHIFVFDMIYVIEIENQKHNISKIYQKDKNSEQYYNQLTDAMKMLYNHNQFFVTHNNFIIQNQLNEYLQLDNKPFSILNNYSRSHDIALSFVIADIYANNFLIKITKNHIVKLYIDAFHCKKLLTYQLTDNDNILLFQDGDLLILNSNGIDINYQKGYNPNIRPIQNTRYDGISKFHRLLYVNISLIPPRLLYHPYFFNLKDINKVSQSQLQQLCEIDLYSVLLLIKNYSNNYFSIDVSRLHKTNIIQFITQYISNYKMQNNVNVQQHYNRILKYCDYNILTGTIYQHIMKPNTFILGDNDSIYIYLYQLIKRCKDQKVIELVQNILNTKKCSINFIEMLTIDLTCNRVNIKIIQQFYNIEIQQEAIYSFTYQTIFFCLSQKQIDAFPELRQQVTIFSIFEQEKDSNISLQLNYYQTNEDFYYAVKIAIQNTANLQSVAFISSLYQQGIKAIIIMSQLLQLVDNSDDQIKDACQKIFEFLKEANLVINPLIFGQNTQIQDQYPLYQQYQKILMTKFLNQKISTVKDAINVINNRQLFYQYINHNSTNQNNYFVDGKHLFYHFVIINSLSSVEQLINLYKGTTFLESYRYTYIKQISNDQNMELVMMLIKSQPDFNQYSQIHLENETHKEVFCTTLSNIYDRFGQCLLRKFYMQVNQAMQQKIIQWCYYNEQLDKIENAGYFSINDKDIFGRSKKDIYQLTQIAKM